MHVARYEPGSGSALLQAFRDRGLTYGDSNDYASLISPCSVTLTIAEVRDLTDDLADLAALYRTANQLYLASLDGQAPKWIRRCVEHGLSPPQQGAHRLIARAGLEPVMTRADYVEIGSSRRQLAEVQWKSGGPGVLIGHQQAYAEVFSLTQDMSLLGDLENSYLASLCKASPSTPTVAVNEVRPEWLAGEKGLASRARKQGWLYIPLNRETLARTVGWSGGRVQVRGGTDLADITVLRGRGFTEVLDDHLLTMIVTAALDGSLWIEAPPNFLYRQKWLLALPFMAAHAAEFTDRIRAVVIPTAIVLGEQVDLTPIVEAGHDGADILANVQTLGDIANLPGGLRSHLVFKCGAGTGPLQSGGRGVFRLSGSKKSAAKTVNLIRQRVANGEPWIVQPFRDATYRVPFELPGNLCTDPTEAHSRLMVFGGRDAGCWGIHGAIGNFSRHWKVSGRRSGLDIDGKVVGSSFVDVRVAHSRSQPQEGSDQCAG